MSVKLLLLISATKIHRDVEELCHLSEQAWEIRQFPAPKTSEDDSGYYHHFNP